MNETRRNNALYDDQNAIQMKTIDEIKKEAQVSFQLTKDRLRVQKDAKKFGQLRPICSDIIQEVREYEEKRISELRARKDRAIASRTQAWSPGPNLHGPSVTTTDSESHKSNHNHRLFRVIRRHDLLPTKSVAAFTIHSLPTNTEEDSSRKSGMLQRAKVGSVADFSQLTGLSSRINSVDHNQRSSPEEELVVDDMDNENKSTGSTVISESDSIVIRAQAASFMWQNQFAGGGNSGGVEDIDHRRKAMGIQRANSSVNVRQSLLRSNSNLGSVMNGRIFRPQSFDEGDEHFDDREDDFNDDDHRPMLQRQHTGLKGSHRNSLFGSKSIDLDEKIAKANKAREMLQHEREERLLKKIQDKEESAHQRQVHQALNEKQKVWTSLIAFTLRMK
jgi:hypothetical protein